MRANGTCALISQPHRAEQFGLLPSFSTPPHDTRGVSTLSSDLHGLKTHLFSVAKDKTSSLPTRSASVAP
jgi:hypothetical protein